MDVDVLKHKIIKEFNCLLEKLNNGYQPDIEFLLEEISFLEICEEIDNPLIMLQYYLNHKWQAF